MPASKTLPQALQSLEKGHWTLWIMSSDQDQDQGPSTKDLCHCIKSMCKDDVYGIPAIEWVLSGLSDAWWLQADLKASIVISIVADILRRREQLFCINNTCIGSVIIGMDACTHCCAYHCGAQYVSVVNQKTGHLGAVLGAFSFLLAVFGMSFSCLCHC